MIARCNVTHLKHVAVFGSGRGRPLEGKERAEQGVEARERASGVLSRLDHGRSWRRRASRGLSGLERRISHAEVSSSNARAPSLVRLLVLASSGPLG